MSFHRSLARWPNGVTLVLVSVLVAVAASKSMNASETRTLTIHGEPMPLGNGTARTYVVMEAGAPVEVGVALTEAALDGLPADGHAGGVHAHGHTTFETVLAMPEENPTPYRYVLMNWNPGGHEPPGIYDLPHLDFHFYTMENAARMAIDPSDPAYQAKAERQPAPELVPQGYILPEPLAFPRMGVHWVDPSSPELNGKVFTHTFIYGSWDGELIFGEPMITRAFLLSKPNVTKTLPRAERVAVAGYYPTAYSISWDAENNEYRIALTGLEPRN